MIRDDLAHWPELWAYPRLFAWIHEPGEPEPLIGVQGFLLDQLAPQTDWRNTLDFLIDHWAFRAAEVLIRTCAENEMVLKDAARKLRTGKKDVWMGCVKRQAVLRSKHRGGRFLGPNEVNKLDSLLANIWMDPRSIGRDLESLELLVANSEKQLISDAKAMIEKLWRDGRSETRSLVQELERALGEQRLGDVRRLMADDESARSVEQRDETFQAMPFWPFPQQSPFVLCAWGLGQHNAPPAYEHQFAPRNEDLIAKNLLHAMSDLYAGSRIYLEEDLAKRIANALGCLLLDVQVSLPLEINENTFRFHLPPGKHERLAAWGAFWSSSVDLVFPRSTGVTGSGTDKGKDVAPVFIDLWNVHPNKRNTFGVLSPAQIVSMLALSPTRRYEVLASLRGSVASIRDLLDVKVLEDSVRCLSSREARLPTPLREWVAVGEKRWSEASCLVDLITLMGVRITGYEVVELTVWLMHGAPILTLLLLCTTLERLRNVENRPFPLLTQNLLLSVWEDPRFVKNVGELLLEGLRSCPACAKIVGGMLMDMKDGVDLGQVVSVMFYPQKENNGEWREPMERLATWGLVDRVGAVSERGAGVVPGGNLLFLADISEDVILELALMEDVYEEN